MELSVIPVGVLDVMESITLRWKAITIPFIVGSVYAI